MSHHTAIRHLAASVTALARVVHSELSRLGIDNSTREVLETVEAQANAVYEALGGGAEGSEAEE
jgi:hypothetical protein